jgi:hypothetical protein
MSNRNIDSIIKAPISGIMLFLSAHQGDPIVPLTNFQPGTELCSMADLKSILFKGTVDEIDVGKIVPGMDAEIQIGAMAENKIHGTLDRIFPKAKKEGNATLFDIEIFVPETSGQPLRAGYSATATITVRAKENILMLPERLVLFENGKRFVEVPDGEATRKVEIRTALPLRIPCHGSVVRDGKTRTMPWPMPWKRLAWARETDTPKASSRMTENVPQTTPESVRAVRRGWRTRSRKRLRKKMKIIQFPGVAVRRRGRPP